MLLGLGILTTLRIIIAIMISTIAVWVDYDQFDEVYWYLIPAVVLLGAGTFHGSNPIRYIFSALLVVAIALEVYLFSNARFPGNWIVVVSIQVWLVSLLMVYIMFANNKVKDFFLYQRARHFGEPIKVVGREEAKAATQTKTAAVKTRKGSANQNDELGIFED